MVQVIKNRETERKRGKNASPLDNIAQLPTTTKETLSKRARSKFYTQKITSPLLYIESPLHKNYERAFHCGAVIKQKGKKVISQYCNSRICHVCNRIRTAKMMAGYIEPLRELGDLYFTTLTIKNVKAENLAETIEKMLKDISNIIRVLRERKKINISGIRKIEITYNSKMDTYHPHFHILHNENVGDIIIEEWLKRNPTAKEKGWDWKEKKMVDLQVSKPVTKKDEDDKKFLNEIFKYATKFVVKDSKDRNIMNVYVPALDNILRALHTKRSVQSFGEIRKLKIAEEEGEQELLSQEIIDIEEETYKEWQWASIDDIYDWLDNNGKRLTNYKPPDIEFTYFIGDISPPTEKEKDRYNKKINNKNNKVQIPTGIKGRLKNIANERM
jgi:plasmid rolling circle replication initiator protein Rep